VRTLFATLAIILLATPVAAHELAVFTVIVNSEGANPANIPDESLKEGDSAWFWMKDSTENTTLIVEIERDGATLRSPVLHYECELDENGTKVDESCNNRFDYTFNQYNSAGQWNFTFLKYVNDELSETSNGSVVIQPDLHDEQNMSEQNMSEQQEASYLENLSDSQLAAGILAIVSLIAMAMLLANLDRAKKKDYSLGLQEEE
tara:strand:- start:130 stop:741 length:612 start_codon:yes stop_codon:yes gene_type:complete